MLNTFAYEGRYSAKCHLFGSPAKTLRVQSTDPAARATRNGWNDRQLTVPILDPMNPSWYLITFSAVPFVLYTEMNWLTEPLKRRDKDDKNDIDQGRSTPIKCLENRSLQQDRNPFFFWYDR